MQLVLSPHYHYLFVGISNPRKCQYAFYLNILNWHYSYCGIELFVVGAVIGIIGMMITISITTLGDNCAIYACECYRCLDFNDCRIGNIVKIFNRKIPFLDKVILKDSTVE